MRKLLIISDMYPDSINPVNGIFVQQQVKMLSKYYRVKVIATSFSHPYRIDRSEVEGIRVVYIYFPSRCKAHILSPIAYRKFCLPIIKDEIEHFSPDIIHVHDCRHIPELFCLGSVLRRFKGKRILTLHNIRTHPKEISNPITKRLYGITLCKALQNWSHIITVNEHLSKLVQQSQKGSLITVTGNAIVPRDVDSTKQPSAVVTEIMNFLSLNAKDSHTLKIFSVGNLVPTKGFDILLKAVRQVSDSGVAVVLVIVGGGDEEQKLRRLISELCLEDRVKLSGRLQNCEVRMLYPLFDAFVLPSWKETFGIVYLEAMEAGLITVGVQGQGIDGVIQHGKNGLLVPPCDVLALSEAILSIAKDAHDLCELRKAAKATVEKGFMMDVMISKLRNIYEA